MQKCRTCEQEKALEAFYPNTRRCKECTKTAVKANRAANADHYKAFDRARSQNPDRVAARLAYQQTDAFTISHDAAVKKWRGSNPDRMRAHSAVAKALLTGKLVRQPCHCCGDVKVEGHHPDYGRPLDVIWLCAKDHGQLHADFYLSQQQQMVA